jgi:hypothetical protein
MIQVIDDFLPASYHRNLLNLMSSDNFPWFYNDCVARNGDGEFFFTHNVFRYDAGGVNSDYWSEFHPMVYFIEEKLNFELESLLRIRCNLYTNQNKELAHESHVDQPNMQHYTGIYYLNTTNGQTNVGTETVDCVANRLVFFSGDILHNSNLQTDQHYRINVNINVQGSFKNE